MVCKTIKKLLSVFLLIGFVALFLFAIPKLVMAGIDLGDFGINTDVADSELVGYWDLRDRESFFQLTNIGGASISVHVTLFDYSSPGVTDRCVEFNFFDTYSGNDTHIYNIRNLTRNNGVALAAPILTDGHGQIVITTGGPSASCGTSDVIIGQSRIIDLLGNYEYRTNALGISTTSDNDDGAVYFAFNFNEINGIGTTSADIIPLKMRIENISGACTVSPLIHPLRRAVIDLGENIVSCPTTFVGCKKTGQVEGGVGQFPDGVLTNLGINQRIPNSREGNILCQGTNASGWVVLRSVEAFGLDSDGCDRSFCGGFVGLNNNDGTGSMDAWVQLDDEIDILGTD